ncbi:MAG TPA: hypothetical protein VGD65_12655 [Chryseosolibacter sp.]
MKKVTQQWDDMLLDFLDGKLSTQQQAIVNDALQTNAEVRKRFDELRSAHEVLQGTSLEMPSRNFTALVMSNLQQAPAHRGLSIKNGLLLLAGIIVVMTIAVVLLSAGVFDQTTTVDLNEITVSQKFIKQNLPSFSIDGKILVNAIVLLNVVIAFLVLDRAVLKPFFQRRLENHSTF